MKPHYLLLLLIGGVFHFSPQIVSGKDASYANPVIPGDHPDPSLIHVGKDYWATATSSEWGPQFPLLHSRDLVNWEQTGEVFAHRPDWATGNFWAPEISQYKGRYYVYYVGRKRGSQLAVAVATADKPAGPYTDHGPIISQDHGSIDPVPCLDENGKPFLVWKDDNNSVRRPTTIWAQPLDDDGLKLIGQPKALIRNDADWEGKLVEGPFVLRRGDWFYLFYSGSGCCGTGCNYAMGVARSHSLLGPWEKNPMNPILTGNDQWKCPGHGSIVTDEKGRYWLLYHAYAARSSVFTGREAMLDEVKFGTNDWPTINAGRGPSVKALSPTGAKQSLADLSFVDNFAGKHLRAGWQWPQDREPTYQLDGHLVLSSTPGRETNPFAAVIARSVLTGDYVATTEIKVSDLPSGCRAGLSAFGDANNAVGLSVGEGKLTLWRRGRSVTTRLAQVNAPQAKKIQLRLVAQDGFKFDFAASVDGKKWIAVGDNLDGSNLAPWDRGIRVALTLEGDDKVRGQFNLFRLTPNGARK